MAETRPGSPEGDADVAGERAALDSLSQRIDTAREKIAPPPKRPAGKYQSLTVAWRMVLELVIGCAFGAAIGYAMDDVAGTGPLFLVVFGLLGFAAGIKTMMASAKQMQRKGSALHDQGKRPALHGQGKQNEGDGLGN